MKCFVMALVAITMMVADANAQGCVGYNGGNAAGNGCNGGNQLTRREARRLARHTVVVQSNGAGCNGGFATGANYGCNGGFATGANYGCNGGNAAGGRWMVVPPQASQLPALPPVPSQLPADKPGIGAPGGPGGPGPVNPGPGVAAPGSVAIIAAAPAQGNMVFMADGGNCATCGNNAAAGDCGNTVVITEANGRRRLLRRAVLPWNARPQATPY